MQGEIVDELESGTAAWMISKPVSRTSFILAKIFANTIVFTIVIIGIPGVVGGLLMTGTGLLTPLGYLAGLGLTALPLIWFMYLTIMLGVLTKSRTQTMGIAIGLLFTIMALGQMIPTLNIFIPVMLPLFVTPWVAVGNLGGMPVPQVASMIPSMIIVPVVEIVLFVIISVWVFRKVEL